MTRQTPTPSRHVKSQILQFATGVCTNPSLLAAAAGSTNSGIAQTAVQLFHSQCAPQFVTLTNDIQPIINNIRSAENADITSLKSTTASSIAFTFYLIIGGIAAVMIGAFFAIRAWLITPVNALQGTMSKLANGDLQAKVVGIERRDEIGGMARAVQVFKEAGIEKQRLEGEAAAQRAASRAGAPARGSRARGGSKAAGIRRALGRRRVWKSSPPAICYSA